MACLDFNCKMKNSWSGRDVWRSSGTRNVLHQNEVFCYVVYIQASKGTHLIVINTTTRRTRRATVLLSISICTLSLLLSVRIVHNVHKLCNVHVEYFVVFLCYRPYMDSLIQEQRIISTFQIFIFDVNLNLLYQSIYMHFIFW